METRALMALLQPERARVLRLVRARVGSPADAEDIAQRALLRAAERASQLHDSARALPWFYRIVRNTVADHHRARWRDPSSALATAELEAIPDDLGATLDSNACPCALRLLTDLRPAYADVVRQIDIEGAAPTTVAQGLGISVANVHVRLHRARQALRSRVQAHCGVEGAGPCLDCSCTSTSSCGD